MVNEFFMFGIVLFCEEMIKVCQSDALPSMIEVFLLRELLLNKYK